MRGYNCHEEIEVYRTADCFCLEAGGNRCAGRRSLPPDGHFRSHILQLEEEVFRSRNELRRLRQFEDENARLKQFVADLPPRQTDAAGCSEKKVLRAGERRHLVQKLIDGYPVSIPPAAAVCLLARSLVYDKAHGRNDRAVRQRIKEIAAVRVRYGMARIHVLLRREGWPDNQKRVRH